MTGLELAPVGDAREVSRTRVRRLDELCRFILNLFFSLDDRACQQLAKLLLLGVEEKK